MSSVPAGRREVNVRGDGIVFTELWLSLLMAKRTMLIQCFEPCVIK